MSEALKQAVLAANLELAASGLAPLTFGNVSGIDRAAGIVVIKPSGVPYPELTADNLAVTDLAGRHLGGGRPSTDLLTHLALYRAWPEIGGVAHTHSECAVAFAQAHKAIPCLGTTHADHFRGPVPVSRTLMQSEVEADYESATGTAVIDALGNRNPLHTPAALVANHGPFTWGSDPAEAVKNSVLLELVARMALATYRLNPAAAEAPGYLQDKHHQRKHGPGAYYGQVGRKSGA